MEDSLSFLHIPTVIAMMVEVVDTIKIISKQREEALPKGLQLSVISWVEKIFTRSKNSPNILVLALIYLRRFRIRHPDVTMHYGGGHRLCFITLILASKYLNDETYTNEIWNEISHNTFTLKIINKMELEFINYIDFEFYVAYDEWLKILATIKTIYKDKSANKCTVEK